MDYEWVRRSVGVLKRQLLRCDESMPIGHWNWDASRTHRYEFGLRLAEREIRDFESQNSVRLPSEYRDFLVNLGNGGAGPGYGVFPLGKMNGVSGQTEFDEFYIGTLSIPFPHTQEWSCDKAALDWDAECNTDVQDEHEIIWKERSFAHFNPKYIDGAIPIADLGCGQSLLLVVTGSELGNLWYDDRADHVGISPMLKDGNRVRFNQWYTGWLNCALDQCAKDAQQ
ncbi:MAG: SMI1/KNR4 family protein [Planctomycetaceae bacterium]